MFSETTYIYVLPTVSCAAFVKINLLIVLMNLMLLVTLLSRGTVAHERVAANDRPDGSYRSSVRNLEDFCSEPQNTHAYLVYPRYLIGDINSSGERRLI